MAIIPVPATRVSDTLIRQRLQSQLQADQKAVLRLQDQLSTGQRIMHPSDDAPAALRAMSIQRLLERKAQMRSNIAANQLFMTASDSALNGASSLLLNVRASALSVIGTTSTDSQRAAVSLEVDSALRELVNTANRQVGGRYLFAGSNVNQSPYLLGNGTVSYFGDQQSVYSYGDLDLLFSTNMTGDEVFGGISQQVLGTVDLNPALTADTRLSDLRTGLGISKGTIAISDGANTSYIDLSRANTLADVVALIEANPPTGRSLRVDITPTGLNVQIDAAGGGNLMISEVGDGSTARDLGIIHLEQTGTAPVVGTDLEPRVALTTRLEQLLGSRASASVAASGGKNDLVLRATRNGAQYNGVTISFVDGGLGSAGSEVAVFDATAKTLTISIEGGVTTANQVITAINAEGTFIASLDKHELDNDGTGTMETTVLDPLATATTGGGSGVDFDRQSGIQIVNGGITKTITFASARTVEDLLNALNGSATGIVARINDAGNGIDVRSYVSGTDFKIGENGGSTATQLGLRSFNESTLLSQLNYGRGVHQVEGAEFVIVRRDGTELNIDLEGAKTIGDVLDRINNHPDNLNPATKVVARLASHGNGIALVNDDPSGTQALQVRRTTQSQAAEDLGFLPKAGTSASATTPALLARTVLNEAGANNNIIISGVQPGTQLNGVTISFVDTGLGAGNETVTYNATARTLVFDISNGVTTANDLVQLVNTDPTVSVVFSAALDPSDGSPNSGAGTYGLTTTATLSGGAAETIVGRDVNPLEVDGVFNALMRLSAALKSNDELGMQRALDLLDQASLRVNFARADFGARQQGLDLLDDRLNSEDTDLRQALSKDLDADFTRVVSDLTARQASLQAALQTTAQTFRLSLLDYL
jgi:flagellar hook-associated protein 3